LSDYEWDAEELGLPIDFDDKPLTERLNEAGIKMSKTFTSLNQKMAWYKLTTETFKAGKEKYLALQKKFSYTVSIPAEDDLFSVAQQWVLDQLPPSKKKNVVAIADTYNLGSFYMRNYKHSHSTIDPLEEWFEDNLSDGFTAVYDSEEDEKLQKPPAIALLQDDDRSNVIYLNGHRFTVNLIKKPQRVRTQSATGNDQDFLSSKYIGLNFTCFSQKAFDALNEKLSSLVIVDEEHPRQPNLRVVDKWYSWNTRNDLPPRPLESIILREGQLEKIVDDVHEFLSTEIRYNRLCIPYHRGYILYGEPGSGKTSIVKAVANHFKMDLWYLPMGDIKTDTDLLNLIFKVGPRSILLLEDLDVFASATKRNDVNAKATLSGLLNALDGVSTPHGLITFITTNNIEALDPALIRPGRIDVKEYIGTVDDSQINRIYKWYFPEVKELPEFHTSSNKLVPAQIIEILKTNWTDPKIAAKELEVFLERNAKDEDSQY
jgi:hypothetical protein